MSDAAFHAEGTLPFTGERMVPGRADAATEVQHRQRYRWAMPLVRGRRVLDVACGEGYGSHRLAGFFPHVRWFRQPPAPPWDVSPGSQEDDLFFLAVCGREPVDAIVDPMVRPVGIVIPVHNELEATRLCVESVATFTPEPIRLVLVDNGSTDGTAAWAERVCRDSRSVTVIRNAENRGFAPAVNQGIAAARGLDVLLLNNDVVVTPGWLSRLLAALREAPDIGLVGSVSNHASPPQQVPVPAYRGAAELTAHALDRAMRNHGRTDPAGRLSGFCLLIRREAVEAVGGFDERFVPGFFEDDDYCHRVRLAGFRRLVAHDVFVHHAGSRTFRRLHEDPASPLRVNWERFKAKWGLPADLAFAPGRALDRMPEDRFRPERDFMPLPPVSGAGPSEIRR